MAEAFYYAQVRYNANGGSGAPAAQSRSTKIAGGGVIITLSSGVPSRQYYTFKGWAYSSSATSGMSGGTQVSFNASTTPSAANAAIYTLYAAWQPETAVLSYNANGGSGAPSSQTVNKNTWFNLRTGVPTRSGYEFVGWNTSSTATAATYQPGGQARIVSNMTLYAVWKVSNSTISTITSSVPIDGSTQGSVSISSINNSYTHQLTLSIGESSQVISLAAGVTSATFTIPSSWLSEVPNSTTGTALASLKTFNGSTQVGGTDVKTFSITVPANIVPVITVATDYVNSNTTVDGWDILLQNFSQIKLTATASGGTGANVATFTFAGDGLSQTSASNEATSSVLTSSGSRSWTVTVTDSRGRTASTIVTDTVHEYFSPSIASLIAFRSDSSGNRDDAAGTYINATGVFSFASADGNNTLSVDAIEYRAEDEQSWTVGEASAVSGNSYTFGGGLIKETKMFHVRLSLTDALGNSASFTVDVAPIVGYAFGLKNDRVHFGGPCKEPGFVCDFDSKFLGVVDIVPRRAYARIVNTGWYRILQFDADTSAVVQGDDGFLVDVTLVEWARQIHKITLAGVLGQLSFVDEFSDTQHNYIDKIRYTQNGTHGYIDVHFSGNNTSNRYQSAFFDIKTVKPEMQQQFQSVDFDAVADAPSGETILTTYTFNASTPFIIESGSNNGWKYRKWSDGRIETWNVVSVSVTLSTVATYYHRGNATVNLPFTFSDYESIQCTAYASTYWMSVNTRTSTSITLSIYDVVNGSQTVWVSVHIIGKL